MWPIIYTTNDHISLHYSKGSSCFAHVNSWQVVNGVLHGMVCVLLLKPVNKDGFDEKQDKMENVRIMDSVRY